MPKKLGSIHRQILDLLKASREGQTIYEIRKAIPGLGIQQHLDKRVRELRAYYKVPQRRGRYFYEGERQDAAPDSGVITKKIRAAILNMAHGRCQMCGRTIVDDGIKLEPDHKIPRNWGGATTIDNLWALCQQCNGGKRDFFATFNDAEMKKIASHKSVYERISEMLCSREGETVPSWLLQFVANVNDFQEDWQKRLRELRYPAIGMKIKATRTKTPSGKWQAAYKLVKWKPLPPNHKLLIKEHERESRKRRQVHSS